MTKKIVEVKPSSSKKIVGGIITLLLSPLLYFVIIVLTEILCNNSCSISSGMQGAFIAIGAPFVAGAIGLIVLTTGIVEYFKSAK